MIRYARRPVIVLGIFILLGLFAAAVSVPNAALAAWRGDGAGGCGQFAVDLGEANPGDLIAPMRGGVNTEGVVISQTLVIQGGWTVTDGNDCDSNGTDTFTDANAAINAGFAFDPSQHSELFGDFVKSVLPLDLRNGQTLVLQNLKVESQNANTSGIAISGVISAGSRLRLENLDLNANQLGVNGLGGAVYLEVRGGSQVVIADSIFQNNNAFAGGAVEVHLYDGSSLLVENSTFSANEALSGDGGALKVILHHGSVLIRNSTFSNNNATNGNGGAIRLERAPDADGPTTAQIINPSYSGNAAGQSDADISVFEVGLIEPKLYLPALFDSSAVSPYQVRINGIAMEEESYRVTFTTSGYTPQLPGRHMHFFFNTVPPEQAGVPGSGPWKIYGGTSPFLEYGIADRPAGATQLCVLVANENHSVIPQSGNCLTLP